jgi:ribosomal protein L18
MKKILFILLAVAAGTVNLSAQASDQLISKCTATAGSDASYLKDFRIQLGKAAEAGEPRYKAQMSLMKNIKYRFTLCYTDDSKGALIVNVKDDTQRIVVTSLDSKTGKTYASVDFICNKTGLYEIGYDFADRQQGSGVGVISMVK